jgi:hypothetical protein
MNRNLITESYKEGEKLEYALSIEKVYDWVGIQLQSCPVRDGVTFYYHSEKIFKVLKRKKGWHIEFSVPVSDCPGLRILTDEEASTRKLGKTRWIYRGESEQVAQHLVEEAMESIPKRRVIDPGMSRELRAITDHSCPCYKKMEAIQENSVLPPHITNKIKEAYDNLQAALYKDFIKKVYPIFEDVVDYLLNENQINIQGELEDKISVLAEQRIISQKLKQEIQSFLTRKVFEWEFTDQERAYPIALTLVTLMSKFLKFCN